MIGCEARRDLTECCLEKGTLKVVVQEKETRKYSSVTLRLLQDTQIIQYRLNKPLEGMALTSCLLARFLACLLACLSSLKALSVLI